MYGRISMMASNTDWSQTVISMLLVFFYCCAFSNLNHSRFHCHNQRSRSASGWDLLWRIGFLWCTCFARTSIRDASAWICLNYGYISFIHGKLSSSNGQRGQRPLLSLAFDDFFLFEISKQQIELCQYL